METQSNPKICDSPSRHIEGILASIPRGNRLFDLGELASPSLFRAPLSFEALLNHPSMINSACCLLIYKNFLLAPLWTPSFSKAFTHIVFHKPCSELHHRRLAISFGVRFNLYRSSTVQIRHYAYFVHFSCQELASWLSLKQHTLHSNFSNLLWPINAWFYIGLSDIPPNERGHLSHTNWQA